jgi:hypothetical protein
MTQVDSSKPAFLFVDYYKKNPQNPSNAQKHALYQQRRKQASIERLKNSAQPLRQLLQFRYTPRNECESGSTSPKSSPAEDDEEVRERQRRVKRMIEQKILLAGRRSPKSYK